MQCHAVAVARYTFELFPRAKDEMVPILDSVILGNGSSASSIGTIATESPSAKAVSKSANAAEQEQHVPEPSDAEQASILDRKLSLESVLRSLYVGRMQKAGHVV